MEKSRCPWCLKDALYKKYHDEVWGVPEKDSIRLFEFLNLEGAQAGLSWYSILVRQENYRKAFWDWDPERIVRITEDEKQSLLQNKGIIRNRLKVEAVISNARVYLALKDKGQDFSALIWSFVNGNPIVNHFETMSQLPASTPLSEKMSKTLKKMGFKFVGPTIVYAFMQATGMVDDHLVSCWKRQS